MDVIITVATIIGVSLLYVSYFQIDTAFAPFASICSITLVLILFGMYDLLIAGLIIVFVFAALGLWFTLWHNRGNLHKTAKLIFSPGMCFFLLSCLFSVYILPLRTPAL